MSRLHRAYLAPGREWLNGSVTLDERESRHLAKVLRVRMGDEIETFNGRGEVRLTSVKQVSPKAVELKSTEERLMVPSSPAFELGVAVPKGKKMDEIVRQATEMGATRLVPLVTNRSEGAADPERWESKRERWRIAAIEACKQSGNAFVPEIEKLLPLQDWLAALSSATFKIVASLESDALPLRIWLNEGEVAERPKEVALLVGPEGDLAPEEYGTARSLGFLPCAFGENVLRVDTAVVCAFAVAKEELQAYLATQPMNQSDD
ncbi:MAG: hypothetical protein CMI32_02465 [Opitutales bacterium]|nr:hypothetical protein [Opitutales bacterium]